MEETGAFITFVESLSYWGIAGLALIANLTPTIPEEIFILVAGYLVGIGVFSFWSVAGILIAGLFISDILLFTLARQGNKQLKKIIDRFFKKMVTTDDTFVRNHAKKIIFFSRFVVQFRFMGPVLGGFARVPWRTFIAYDLLALIIYVPIVLQIGNYFQERIRGIIDGVGIAKDIILIVLGIFVIFVVVRTLRKKYTSSYSLKKRVLSYFNDAIMVDVSKNSSEDGKSKKSPHEDNM